MVPWVYSILIGTLSKQRMVTATKTWKNKRSNEQDNSSLNTCILKLCTFLSRSLQNNSVKSSKFVWSEKGNPNGKLFQFLFGTQRRPHTLCRG